MAQHLKKCIYRDQQKIHKQFELRVIHACIRRLLLLRVIKIYQLLTEYRFS